MDEAYDGSPFGEHCPKGRFSERPPAIQRCHMRQDFSGDHPLEHMIINFEDENITLETIGLLGQGGFGKVFAARSDRGDSFAVKVSSKKMTENDWKRLAEEVSLMSHFSDHPNIVKFFTAGKDDDRAYVVMEQCASRSLHDVIAARALDIPEILWIGWSLVNTISYIHSEECIHRDLKPQNLLFDLQGNLKITDFGLSSRISDTQPRKTVAGTAMYMAPALAEEVYKRLTKSSDAPSLSYGKEVDTWSIGVVMYVLLTRMNPYLDAIERKGVNGLDKEQKQLALFNAVAHAAWEWPDGWSGDRQLRQLVEKILDPNPNARSSLFQVLHDPVWNRRPKTCPDTLLQKLNLLERPFGLQPLHTITGNVLVSKKSLDPPPTDQLSRIASTEQHLRSHIMNEYQRSFEILLHQARIINLEFGQRTVVVRQEKSFRSQIQSTLWCQIQTDKEAGLPVIGSQPQVNPRALRRSVSLMSDDSQYGLSPRTSGMVTVDRKNSTRRSMTSASSINPNLIEVEYKCMNRHIMTKLTSMPHSYNGFDCNVCDRGILRISADRPAFRCYKCDYDICLKCVVSGKVKDVNYVCPSCSKKFTTTTKLQAHTLNCRGPSESPSPRRSSRMNTMLWDEETKRPSLLEVQLPLPEPESKHYDSPRSSGRATYVRTSAGGRISLGDTAVPRAEDVGHLVMNHQSANFPDVNQLGTKQRRSAKRGSLSSDESLLNGLPSPVQLPDRTQQSVRKPRSSAELPGTELFTKHGNNFSSFEPGTPPQHNDRGEIIGIAARRQSERSAEVNLIDRGVITIRADTADRPRDMMRQPRVPRSASSARSQQKPMAHSPVKRMREEYREEEVVTKSSRVETSSLPQIAGGRKNYTGPVRAPSVSGHTAQGGPPLPRRGPGAPLSPGSMTRTSYLTSAAIPSKSFVSAKPSQLSMARTGTSSNTVPRPGAASGVVSGSALGNSAGAFLALPKEAQHRKQFLDDFLSGGWVRYYSFTNEDTVVLFYCLQPGRYGAMFPTETGVGTAVLDLDSKMVLYVPCMNNESTNRSQPHPHVQTFYEEEARMLSFSEAQRYLGGVLRSIMSFVDEMARLKAEGLTPAAVHAAYIHHSNLSSVPRDTKFVYIRKVFPDPSGSFTLFRLSNLRSQVVCNAMVDIRWQSDRRHNVGQKYYVHADGSAEPFVVDQTGILSEVETVLNNSFRRS